MNQHSTLGNRKLTTNVFTPEKGTFNAAGFDLRGASDYVVPKLDRKLIKTDLAISLAVNCYVRFSFKLLYWCSAHVLHFIWSLYENFDVKRGDEIAQLICEVILYPKLEEIFCELPKRGDLGFGSTDIKNENKFFFSVTTSQLNELPSTQREVVCVDCMIDFPLRNIIQNLEAPSGSRHEENRLKINVVNLIERLVVIRMCTLEKWEIVVNELEINPEVCSNPKFLNLYFVIW